MIIGIESVWGNKSLSGQTLSFEILNAATKEILKQHDETSFVDVFCARFGYKQLPYWTGYAAYYINLDTHRVFVASSTFPKELDGAKVLYYTDRGVFDPVYYPGGEIAHNVFYLAICKYENGNDYYVFHCDEDLTVVADNCFHSIEQCKNSLKQKDMIWHKQTE